jgi:hypothetical protein
MGVCPNANPLDANNQALPLARFAKDPQQETTALNGIQSCYRDQRENGKVLGLFQHALDLATGSVDLRG